MEDKKRFRVLLANEIEKVVPDEEGFGYRDESSYLVEFPPEGPPRLVGSDGGEPEDNTFGRDWSWVVGELNNAYDRGVVAGAAANLKGA